MRADNYIYKCPANLRERIEAITTCPVYDCPLVSEESIQELERLVYSYNGEITMGLEISLEMDRWYLTHLLPSVSFDSFQRLVYCSPFMKNRLSEENKIQL